MLEGLIISIQLFFSCVIGMYFLMQLKGQSSNKTSIYKDATKRREDMEQLRQITLSLPLSESISTLSC